MTAASGTARWSHQAPMLIQLLLRPPSSLSLFYVTVKNTHNHKLPWRSRSSSSFRGRKRPSGRNPRRRKENHPHVVGNESKTDPVTLKSKAAGTTATTGQGRNTPLAAAGTNPLQAWVRDWLVPVRYRFPRPRPYGRKEGWALAYRIPLWVALALTLTWWDETCAPCALIRIHGPSMLPTMAADGSEIWLCRTYPLWRRRMLFAAVFPPPLYQRGDVVGFAHPDHPHAVSCKRIVGVAGDRVQRYGQYVHLYIDQDPEHWGLTWPETATMTTTTDPPPPHHHAWIDRTCRWDDPHAKRLTTATSSSTDRKLEAYRTIVVPDGHVWVEADCPALGLDSRQFGPVPVDWLRGKIVARLWPFWRTTTQPGVGVPSCQTLSFDNNRPHPIPLDKETLMEHNVYRFELE